MTPTVFLELLKNHSWEENLVSILLFISTAEYCFVMTTWVELRYKEIWQPFWSTTKNRKLQNLLFFFDSLSVSLSPKDL